MGNGEGITRMPPNSTQNLNAKLSASAAANRRLGTPVIRLEPPAIRNYSPPVRIVGGAASYRGGYHLHALAS